MVVLNVPVPLPFTSPVKAINWSPVLFPSKVTLPKTVNVVFVFVPPATLNPFANAVGVTPFIVLLVSVSVPLNVAIVPLVGSVTLELPVVVIVVE